MSSKQERNAKNRARNRADICRAAAVAFARNGPKGTTIQQVASEAGYTPAALYSYFDGKDDIFAAIMEGLSEQVIAIFEVPMPEGLTFAERLALLFASQCRIAEEYRHSFFLLYTANPEQQAEGMCGSAEAMRTRQFTAYAEHLTVWIDAATVDGDLVCSAADAATVFIGIGYSFFRRWLHEGGEESLSEQAIQVVGLFLNGVQRSPTEGEDAR